MKCETCQKEIKSESKFKGTLKEIRDAVSSIGLFLCAWVGVGMVAMAFLKLMVVEGFDSRSYTAFTIVGLLCIGIAVGVLVTREMTREHERN